MLKFRQIFQKKACSIVGMVHVDALPGAPLYKGCVKAIIQKALDEAMIYKESGVDGVLMENTHDRPYVKCEDSNPETTALMTRICTEIRKQLPNNIPCGVQILASRNEEALAVAKAAELQFIRAEGYVFSHIADEGFTDACAGTLLRYRSRINADDVLIFADIKKKHSSHAITSDVSLTQTAEAAEFFLADGLIVTGDSTGVPACPKDLQDVKNAFKGPVIIGSGVTLDNLHDYVTSNAIIIGSHFKFDGKWINPIDKDRVKKLIHRLNESILHEN